MNIIEYVKSFFAKKKKIRKTQTELILEHLQMEKPLNSKIAKELYNCKHLRSRIYDLKKKGYTIHDEKVNINGRSITHYSL